MQGNGDGLHGSMGLGQVYAHAKLWGGAYAIFMLMKASRIVPIWGIVGAHASVSLGTLLFLKITGLVDAAKLIEAKMTTIGVW